MRLFNCVFLASATVFALPSPRSDRTARTPSTLAGGLTLIQALNTSSHLTDDWPTICYNTSGSRAVNRLSCIELISYFMSRPGFDVPLFWAPGPHKSAWRLHGCEIRIVSGKWGAEFSMRDVVEQAERVLAVCQPPRYAGVGGSTPVDALPGFMYASFHVQVTGVAP